MMVDVTTMAVSVHDGAGCASLFSWLDGAECERVAGLASPIDAELFIAAHALARSALSAADGGDPAGWSFVREPGGKSRARRAGGRPGPEFSLAHARAAVAAPLCGLVGLVGVAVARGPECQVGFDLEGHDPTLCAHELARVLSATQAAAIAALPAADQPAALVRLWSLKEAYVKATGRGLSTDLSTLAFDGSGRGSGAERAHDRPSAGWHFVHRRLPTRFSAALAVQGPAGFDLQVRWREVSASGLAAGVVASPCNMRSCRSCRSAGSSGRA